MTIRRLLVGITACAIAFALLNAPGEIGWRVLAGLSLLLAAATVVLSIKRNWHAAAIGAAIGAALSIPYFVVGVVQGRLLGALPYLNWGPLYWALEFPSALIVLCIKGDNIRSNEEAVGLVMPLTVFVNSYFGALIGPLTVKLYRSIRRLRRGHAFGQ